LGAPPATVRPIAAAEIDAVRAARERPPGLYGSEDAFRALNLLRPGDGLQALDLSGLPGTRTRTYVAQGAVDLRPWALGLAALLLVLDSLAVLALSGGLRLRGAAAAIALLMLLPAPPADAQGKPDEFSLKASLETRLAYVITGNSEIDNTSRAGLLGLSRFLAARTAFEPAEPMGVDVARDELAFFPLLYWPIDAQAAEPSAEVLARVDAFMKNGGTILFDTRDEILAPSGGQPGPGMQTLRRMLSSLDLPPLEPAPSDHVVTKSFYLLQDFPGRYSGGQLWVEAMPEASTEDRPARPGDGVSPILITSNDLAGAWAVDDGERPLYPTVPADPRQRELAFRAGVNIVMYALTGNYKADQVHVPALLERLGQ
ncbi:MAG: DUF4159 domain-containing protein, partial [Pseudomonadota bacterium]|nr:DUF4159 domain-containing protein [Pseudomonadota bacterium]